MYRAYQHSQEGWYMADSTAHYVLSVADGPLCGLVHDGWVQGPYPGPPDNIKCRACVAVTGYRGLWVEALAGLAAVVDCDDCKGSGRDAQGFACLCRMRARQLLVPKVGV